MAVMKRGRRSPLVGPGTRSLKKNGYSRPGTICSIDLSMEDEAVSGRESCTILSYKLKKSNKILAIFRIFLLILPLHN